MNPSHPTTMYNYQRDNVKLSTPNVQIAFARKDTDGILVETITDGVSEISNLEVMVN